MSVSLLIPGQYISNEATESDAFTSKAGGNPVREHSQVVFFVFIVIIL
jgi:hypothetical protein